MTDSALLFDRLFLNVRRSPECHRPNSAWSLPTPFNASNCVWSVLVAVHVADLWKLRWQERHSFQECSFRSDGCTSLLGDLYCVWRQRLSCSLSLIFFIAFLPVPPCFSSSRPSSFSPPDSSPPSQAKVRELEEKCRSQSEQFNLLSKELEKFRLHAGKFDILSTEPLTVCESPGSPNKSLSQLLNGLAAPTGKGRIILLPYQPHLPLSGLHSDYLMSSHWLKKQNKTIIQYYFINVSNCLYFLCNMIMTCTLRKIFRLYRRRNGLSMFQPYLCWITRCIPN